MDDDADGIQLKTVDEITSSEIQLDDYLNSSKSVLGIGKWQITHAMPLVFFSWFTNCWQVLMLSFFQEMEIFGENGLSDSEVERLYSILFLGWMNGSYFWSYLGDRFGRRPVTLVSGITVVACAIPTLFAVTFLPMAICRFMTGFCVAGFGLVTYVHGAEYVAPRHQITLAAIANGSWALASIFLAGLALIVPGWRFFMIVTLIPAIMVVAFSIFCIPESVRWLNVNKKPKEAIVLLHKVAVFNNEPLPENASLPAVVALSPGSPLLLFAKSIRSQTFVMAVSWFNVSFVYYGLTLNPKATEQSNLYLNAALSGTFELCAYIVCQPILRYCGRKKCLIAFYFLCGMCLLGTHFFQHQRIIELLQLLGKFLISADFLVMYVVSSEVFPTSIRNVGFGMGSLMSRSGAIVAPLISSIFGIERSRLIFAAVAIFSALVCILLKETKGSRLKEVLDEEMTAQKDAQGKHGSEDDTSELLSNLEANIDIPPSSTSATATDSNKTITPIHSSSSLNTDDSDVDNNEDHKNDGEQASLIANAV